ncbi:hypothetical protein FVB9288_03098 [Flavobacterium sp. CECT 9288]|nr:hypothetical protein FVB9288_03098 [Flavobacterium sp. CECT 9288]
MQIKTQKIKNMKNIVILLLISFNLQCKAQTIIPVEKVIDYMVSSTSFPAGSYIKDVNHKLDIFTGTWKGVHGDKIYSFTISKFTDIRSNIKEDILIIRYLITNTNGYILEDTRSLPDLNPYLIQGYYLEQTTYALTYGGKNAKCGQTGTIFIDWLKGSNKTKMTLFLEPEQIIISSEECPNGRAAQIIPHEQIILSKE